MQKLQVGCICSPRLRILDFSLTLSSISQLEYSPGGELFSHLRRLQRFNSATARFYGAEIVLILAFLHDTLGVVYRDLKPENLLLDGQGHIKLVDFGFAKKVGNRMLAKGLLMSNAPLATGD